MACPAGHCPCPLLNVAITRARKRPVLVLPHGPEWTVGRTIFEMWMGL